MADQGLWFKLWLSADDDPILGNLELIDFARWCKFGMYLKKHGNDGMICLSAPALPLQQKLRLSSFQEVVETLRKFPNCVVDEKHNSHVTPVTILTVTWENWRKYQGDFSGGRVRKFRQHVTDKKRREEKRTEEKEKVPPKPPIKFSKPTAPEVTAYAASIGFRLDGERFCAHYESKGWMIGKSPMKDWRSAVVTWKKDAPLSAMILARRSLPPPDKPMTEEEQREGLKALGNIKTILSEAKGIPK